jgi:hypothetical protein
MKRLLAVLFALAVALPPAHAEERTPYSQAELDQMLAPIALYPDGLLSQVLMASTYPLEVVEAARWSRAHPGLQGDEAVRAAQDKDWDPSVKSLLAFPKLLERMDEQLEWTKRLGDAFLEQEPHVMETVQQLRRRARAAGQLAPDERLRVADDGGSIVIEPASPQVVYVPYYDPLVMYGAWWWPAYPPVVWAPWPGYVAYRPGIWWGTGVSISVGFFFGGVSWPQRHVTVVRVSPYYVRPLAVHRDVVVRRPIVVGRWQHDATHRRGVVYRSPELQRKFVPAAPARVPRAAPARRAQPPSERREQRPEIPRKERREERRDERRGRAMPPAFGASAPAAAVARQQAPRGPAVQAPRPEARMAAPRAVQPRMRVQQPQPRIESRPQMRAEAARPQPRVEVQRPQPRMAAPRAEQPGIGVQRSQPRVESRPQMRGEARSGGNGGGRGSGWR